MTLLQFLLSDRKNKLIETQVRVCCRRLLLLQVTGTDLFPNIQRDNSLFRPEGRQSLSQHPISARSREGGDTEKIDTKKEREKQEGVRAN